MFTGLTNAAERKGEHHEAYVVLERLFAHPDVMRLEVCHDPPTVIVIRASGKPLRVRGKNSFIRVACVALAAIVGHDA